MRFSSTTKAWVESILSDQPCNPLITGLKKKLEGGDFKKNGRGNCGGKLGLKKKLEGGDFKKNGRGGCGGKLGLKKKLEGGLMKKVDGGLGFKKNRVDNGLGLEKKFQGGLGLNKGVEGVDHGLLCTPSTSSEVSSSQGCSSFMSGCETPVTVLRPHLCRASPVKAASKSDHEMNNDLSPRRAARVAMLKARFANTILKAEHHHALYTTTTTTEAKNERLGAAEAEIMRANEFIKKQRQTDREAARLALEEMEKHVVIEDNFKTMRDFHMLISGAKMIDFGRLLLGEIVYSDH
ncbi:hypothetical protein ACE6H2_001781 [Prunus campanulata]